MKNSIEDSGIIKQSINIKLSHPTWENSHIEVAFEGGWSMWQSKKQKFLRVAISLRPENTKSKRKGKILWNLHIFLQLNSSIYTRKKIHFLITMLILDSIPNTHKRNFLEMLNVININFHLIDVRLYRFILSRSTWVVPRTVWDSI